MGEEFNLREEFSQEYGQVEDFREYSPTQDWEEGDGTWDWERNAAEQGYKEEGLYDDGNAWGNLRDEMPKIARAEAMARAEIVCELIYKRRNYSKRETSPKTVARTPGTPSLTPPCYMSPLLKCDWDGLSNPSNGATVALSGKCGVNGQQRGS